MDGVSKCVAILNNRLTNLTPDELRKDPSPVRPVSNATLETNNNHLASDIQTLDLTLLRPSHLENGQFRQFLPIYFAKPKGMRDTLTELIGALQQMNKSFGAIAALAPGCDLEPQNPSNGYRTMMKTNTVAVRDLLKQLMAHKFPSMRTLRRHVYLIKLIALMDQLQLSFRALSEETRRAPIDPNMFHQDLVFFWLKIYEQINPFLESYYAHHLYFFLPAKFNSRIRWLMRTIVSIHRIPFSLSATFNNRKFGSFAAQCMNNPNMRFPIGLFASMDDAIFRKLVIGMYHRRTPVRASTYFVPKQRQWILTGLQEISKRPDVRFSYHATGEAIETAWELRKVIKSLKFGSKPDSVRVRILRHPDAKPDGTVLFHCHGGLLAVHYDFVFQLHFPCLSDLTPNQASVFTVQFVTQARSSSTRRTVTR
jgi:hypothetical protein